MTQQTSDLFQNKLRSFDAELAVLIAQQPSLISLLASPAADGRVAIRSRSTVTQHRHEFTELAMSPEQFEVNGAHTYGDTTLSLVDATGAVEGMILAFEGTDELARVSQVAGSVITVARGYGDTTKKAPLADGMLVRVVSIPRPEGSDPDPDANKVASVNYNFTEIFDDTYKVSGTTVNTDLGGIQSIINTNAMQSMLKVTRRLNMATIYGYRVQRSQTERGSMGGILQFVTNKINAAGQALSQKIINDGIETIFSNGGAPTALVCNTNQARRIAAFYANQLLVLRGDETSGSSVQQFQSDLPNGVITTIVVEPNFPRTKVGILDMNKIYLEFMQGRGLMEKDATLPAADAISRRLLCEATLEVLNGDAAHAIIENLAV